MVPPVSALASLLRLEAMRGFALVAADRTVLQSGFGAPVQALHEAAATARHLFRETAPPVRYLDLSFAAARVVVVPMGAGVLLLRGDPHLDVASLLAHVERQRELLRGFAESPHGEVEPAPPPVEAARPPSYEAGLAGLNLIAAEVRTLLGGPVVRHYLRRAQKELAATHPLLGDFSADLEGRVSGAPREGADLAAVALAMGHWGRALVAGAATVAPELSSLDLRRVTAPLGRELEAAGFYD